MPPAFHFLPASYRPRLWVGRLSLAAALIGSVHTSPASESTEHSKEKRNAVELFAREWEESSFLKDDEPADSLAKALQRYFKILFADVHATVPTNPHDLAGVVGEVRKRLAGETGKMIEAFVAAGYKRPDAELYFDRLFPRLLRELVTLASPENVGGAKAIQQEDATISDELVSKADRLRREKKDLVGALMALEDALRFAPAQVRLTLELALTQQKFGQLREARENFDLARELYPGLIKLHVSRGLTRFDVRDYYGVIEDFTTVIYLDPRMVLAYSTRGSAKGALGDFQGAIDDFGLQIASGYRGGLELAHLQRAQAHFDLGNLALAQADVEDALELKPRFVSAHRMLGLIQRRLGNYGAALASLNRALELEPAYASALSSRIWVRYELGQAEAALGDADRLVALAPDSATPRLVRGSLFDLLDRREAAEKEYRETIDLALTKRDTRTWYYANFHLDLLLRRHGASHQHYLKDVLDWEDGWQKRVALHLAGRITMDSLLVASRQASDYNQRFNQGCEANYYAGMLLWIDGRLDEAITRLKAAADPAYLGNYECTFARKILRDHQFGRK